MDSINGSNNGGKWATKRQVAEHLQCSPRTVNNLMSRRLLPYRKIGNLLRFNLEECDKALDAYKVRSITERKC